MVLFLILALIAIILLIVVIFSVAIGGAGMIIIFGDVIVCIAIIVGICYLIARR